MVFLVNNLLHLCQTTALNWGDISIPPVAKPGNFLRKKNCTHDDDGDYVDDDTN